MITEKEITATKLSETKKDFYQIWEELLSMAATISERWSPDSTNESDPGIVLLKLLAACADRLNYDIDKKTLEAFMPSAAEEESMRKLCDMMGYAMKYYQSAETNITVSYTNDISNFCSDTEAGKNGQIIIPQFTQFTNTDKDIIYTTTEQGTISRTITTASIPAIEGTLSYCEEDSDSIVTINNIDDNYRYYLPVTDVAENGIFIRNINDSNWSSFWTKVDNLNSQPLKSNIYKFGYDSKKFLPYIQFPEDISSIIEDGLQIAYIVTGGVNGNISKNTINSFETPSGWDSTSTDVGSGTNTTGIAHTATEFTCYNVAAATNGANKESLNNAYKNFKKTTGTFDTLVTCRDYMNKIAQLTASSTDSTPLVSNSIVSDIRDDINRASTICSFNEFGINYIDKAAEEYFYDEEVVELPTANAALLNKVYKLAVSGSTPKYYKCVYDDLTTPSTPVYKWGLITDNTQQKIDNFDLLLYPYKTVHGLNTKSEFVSSFQFDDTGTFSELTDRLADYKTISHKINLPEDEEIACIKNYLKLNAKITTNNKVNSAEWSVIKNNIKTAIYSAFNLNQLDFSEEIPFDDILDVIENSDTNIKNVSLNDPDLYSVVMLVNNHEYILLPDDDADIDTIIEEKLTADEKASFSADKASFLSAKKVEAKKLYNKLALRNILAGRVELFNYVTDFIPNVTESKNANYDLIYPNSTTTKNKIGVWDMQNGVPTEYPEIPASASGSYTYYFSANDYFVPTNIGTSDNWVPNAISMTATETSGVWTWAAPEKTAFSGTIDDNEWLMYNGTTWEATPHTVTAVDSITSSLTIKGQSAAAETTDDFYTLGENDIVQFRAPNFTTIVTYPAYVNYFIKLTGTSTSATAAQFKTLYSYLNTDDNYLNFMNAKAKSTSFLTHITTETDYTKYEERYGKIFVKPASGNYTVATGWEEDPAEAGKPKYDYVILELNANTFGLYSTWIESKGLYGIYRTTGFNSTLQPGYLVDENRNKYILCTAWYNLGTVSPLLSYYVPNSSSSLGVDAVVTGLTKDTEYQLGTNEYLCINYTNATSSVDEMTETSSSATVTTTSETINVYYGPGTIIRPSFELVDSATKRAYGSNYAKTSGYHFDEVSVPGMYSLGTDEQIEIRDIVRVFVYDESNTATSAFSPVYVYFHLNDESSTDDYVTLVGAKGASNATRVLQEGEYFWYTDKNKYTLTYCGAGSKLINRSTTAVKKKLSESQISVEEILEANNINIIPWITVNGLYIANPASPATTDNYIEWDESQYITLGSGDRLIAASSTSTSSDHIEFDITKDETACKYAKYLVSGEDAATELPKISVKDKYTDEAISWMIRTKLLMDFGPGKDQTLNSVDGKYEEKITVVQDKSEVDFKEVSLKSNYTINSTLDSIPMTTITDFAVKAVDQQEISKSYNGTSEAVPLNNVNNYYTSISFDKYVSDPYVKLYYVSRSTDEFGLLMFYYMPANAEPSKDNSAGIKLINTSGTTEAPLAAKIYNYYSGSAESWWADYTRVTGTDTIYAFKPGINIVKIENTTSARIEICGGTGTTKNSDLLTFGQLDIIKCNGTDTACDKGINLSLLKYFNTTGTTPEQTNKARAEQLLADIKSVDADYEFFYNAILDNSLKLNINTNANETLATETIWYDYNNTNNKFVVSEIDSDYLDNGIVLVRSSSK